ncbi:actin-like ATPase domain-containing protein [Multifurca ochricompacta]|uniref:Actin-like ATPase domain-containing protein n=1 Tax=Multifurca ochricompacta TaxID=376703 RepID=A0AAD4M973_9AGAM|nr:actin-like ATPase domain-containing protein [Multifurca ochricompacta]
MASIGFRDSSVVIIETSRTVIRGGLGLHELLRAPSFEIQARVGLRAQHASIEGNYGPKLTVGGSGEAGPSTSNSRAASAIPQSQHLKVTDYLVGPQLDDALAAGQDIIVSWPFAEGQIKDFMQAEALWKYVLFTGLQLRRVQNESPVLLSLFPGLPRDTYERTGQIFFERFNVAAFSILDRPMAQLYSAGTLSGIVVDIGETLTDITPIYDGLPLSGARTIARIGTRDCERFLAHLLRNNTSVIATLAELAIPPAEQPTALRALARQVWQAGLVRVPVQGVIVREVEDEGVTDIAAVLVAGKEKAVIENGMKRRATAKASAAEQARAKEIEALDLATVEFRGKEVTVGKERHRFCEPLFDLSLLSLGDGSVDQYASPEVDGLPMTLHDAAGHAVRLADVDQRQYIWHGLMVTGDIAAHVKGIAPALQTHLSTFILTNADQHNEVQPRQVRILKVPEYFAEYREKGDGLAAFLGSSIVAKVTFHDGKNFISKADYAERGPKAVLEMSASLF